MPLPSFTVTGDLNDILGNISGGELVADTFTCSDHRRYATGRFVPNLAVGPHGQYFVSWDGDLYRVGPVEFQITASGLSRGGDPVMLLANDAGLSVEDLQWTVEIPGMEPFTFNAPADGGSLDLGAVAPAVQVEATVNTLTAIQDAVDAAFANFFIDLDEWDPYDTFEDFPGTGTTGIVYVALTTSAGATAGSLFLWNGSDYVPASQDMAVRTHSAAVKATPIENDEVPLVDTGASNVLKRLPLKNLQVMYRRARSFDATNGVDDYAAAVATLAEGAREFVVRTGNSLLIAPPVGGVMLAPPSNTRIIIEEGATVQVKANALGLYYLFNLNGVQNVTIEGAGTLLGDSPTHTGSTGHHGHLINITNGASDCRILGPLHLKQAWGDGIFIGTTALCNDVLVDGAIIEDARRCGINVFWVDGCEIRNTRIFDISLTAFEPTGCPGYGIGIEPNASQLVNNVVIDNANVSDCAGNAVAALGHFATVSNVIIRDVRAFDCANNSGATAGSPHGIRVKSVDDPQIINNTVIGTGWVGATAVAGLTVDLCNRAKVSGGRYADARGPGVYINSSPNAVISDAFVYNSLRRGVLVNASDDVTVRDIELVDNCQDELAGTAHVQILGSDRVAVQGNIFRGDLADAWVALDASSTDCAVEDNRGFGTAPTAMLSNSGTNTRRSNNFRIDTGVYEAWDVTGSTPMGTVELGHATDTTVARSAAGRVTVEGAEIITATAVAAIDAKTTPVDADTVVVFDSAASGVPKKTTWANIKTTLATWLETLAATWSNKTLSAVALTGIGNVAQSGTLAWHNQADQTTNYERARHYWTSDIYTITTEAGGSGALRTASLQAGTTGGAVAVFGSTQNATVGTVRLRAANLSAASACTAGVNGTLSGASGTQYCFSISPTFNQSSSAGYTALLVNPTETATGSGTKLLADFQVGGVSKAKIDRDGIISGVSSLTAGTVPTRAAVPATASSTGTAGQIAWDASHVYVCTATNTWVRAAVATW